MEIKETLRNYFQTYLKGGEGQELRDDTPLLSSGIIDSIGVVGLVDFIENRFKIEFLPRELDRDALETIDNIDQAIRAKLAASNAR